MSKLWEVYEGGPDTRLVCKKDKNKTGDKLMGNAKLLNELGIKVLQEKEEIDLNKLQYVLEYQRGSTVSKVNELATSITKWGWLPNSIITISEDNRVIDGNQRTAAAVKAGLPSVPVCRLKFPSVQTEALYFIEINNYKHPLKPLDYWHARMVAEDPLAKLIYKLNNDYNSKLYNKITIKGHSDHKNKLTIIQIIDIMLPLIGVFGHWQIRIDGLVLKTLSVTPYEAVLLRVNKFFDWFYDCFGENKKDNKIQYSLMLYANTQLYHSLVRNNLLHPKNYRDTVDKIRKIPLPPGITYLSLKERYDYLVMKFNSGRIKKSSKLPVNHSE